MTKALPAIVRDGILSGVGETAEHQVAADQCTSSTLARIAVDINHIFRVLFQEMEHGLTGICKQVNGRTVMVLPVVVSHAPLEWLFIVHAATQIKYPKLLLIMMLNKFADLTNGITIDLLEEVGSRVGHCVDARGYCRDIQVETIVCVPITLARNKFANPIHVFALEIIINNQESFIDIF